MAELDVLVIGAGTAGAYAAYAAQRNGRTVGIVERGRAGGDCVFHACIPTKALVSAARAYRTAKEGGFFGLPVSRARADYAKVKAFKDRIVAEMSAGQEESLVKSGMRLFKGVARFGSPHEVIVGDESVRAQQIVIATGSRPVAPPVPGLAEAGYITNVEALELDEAPARLAIIGGGPVGCEFAQIFSTFGSRVKVFEAAERILINEDREVSAVLADVWRSRGIGLAAGAKVSRVERTASSKLITFRDAGGSELNEEYDEVLVAAGRAPNVEELNLTVAGVDAGKKGIPIDEAMQTNVPHIWAAGDVTGTFLFTLIAWEQGEIAGWNAASPDRKQLRYDVLPRVTFSDPEIASVGFTEDQARQRGLSTKAGRWDFSAMPRAIVSGETDGFVKVVVEEKSGRILGGHIIGAQASSLVHELATAMTGGLTVADIGNTLHAYPTLSEGVRYACQNVK